VSKPDSAPTRIKKALFVQGKLGFCELMRATGLSRGAVNTALNTLQEEKEVEKGIGSRGKYQLLKSSQQKLIFEELANQIKTATVYMEPPATDNPTTATYLLMEVNKHGKPLDANPNADPMKNHFARASVDFATFGRSVHEHHLDLKEKDLKEIARKEGLPTSDNDETLKEKVLRALSERMKRIILVEVLDPALMLEEIERRKTPAVIEKEAPVNRCSECGSQNLVYDHESGEIACGDCGLVKPTHVFA
jgi:ribosomal protein S27AE